MISLASNRQSSSFKKMTSSAAKYSSSEPVTIDRSPLHMIVDEVQFRRIADARQVRLHRDARIVGRVAVDR